MSQDSVDTLELNREIEDSNRVHQNLLDYSTSSEPLILPKEMADIPLPPQTVEEIHSLNWSEEEMSILIEHQTYYQQMYNVIENAKTSGSKNIKIPSPPKRKLKDIFDSRSGKKRKQIKMTPSGFHTYLQNHIQDMALSVSREPFRFKKGDNVSIESGIDQLKEAYKHLCRQNAQSMLLNCEFGSFLNDLYKWFEQMKVSGQISVTWQVWLNRHINISASHARNLRQLATIINAFPKLKTLDLPLNDVLRNQKLLKEMLEIGEFAAFWEEDCNIPLHSHPSQESS